MRCARSSFSAFRFQNTGACNINQILRLGVGLLLTNETTTCRVTACLKSCKSLQNTARNLSSTYVERNPDGTVCMYAMLQKRITDSVEKFQQIIKRACSRKGLQT